MSQIDEAFIRAYATTQPSTPAPFLGTRVLGTTTVPRPHQHQPQSRPPLERYHGGPHIRLPAASLPVDRQLVVVETPMGIVETERAAVETQLATWGLEPIPMPHFHVPSMEQDIVSQTDTVAAPAQVAAQVVAHQTAAARSVEPATQRRPLSTFSAPEQPANIAFNPLFEVDAFRWPKITDDLLAAHEQLLSPIIEQLLTAGEQGRSLVGIAGTRLGIGCTTVQMCLARMIARAGRSVALVDANFAQATLARNLGLEFESGWEDVLTERMPLAECVVKSLQDRMALLPLAQPNTTTAFDLLASIQTSVTAGVLRYHYDLVLFNLGAAGQLPQLSAAQSVMQHCRLDASIIVADTTATGSGDAAQIDPLMSLFGKTCLGVIGNSAAG